MTRIQLTLCVLLFVFQVFNFSNFALASSSSSEGFCPEDDYLLQSGRGDVPSPFDTANRTVELADGGIYFFQGKVIYIPDSMGILQPYLTLDLQQYRWLANAKRTQSPLYPLEVTDDPTLMSWSHLPMKLFVRAHGRIVQNKNGPEYVIYLEPLMTRVQR